MSVIPDVSLVICLATKVILLAMFCLSINNIIHLTKTDENIIIINLTIFFFLLLLVIIWKSTKEWKYNINTILVHEQELHTSHKKQTSLRQTALKRFNTVSSLILIYTLRTCKTSGEHLLLKEKITQV
ncbi:uncharacterized protein LOC130636307 [Hydractinia symbiolongicarpus]|uniref:uncharacterized protein LOC130636307 n=1 Tax=Hydractinia symbiolongicarpus TaxID=13093 RepID=UPI00254F6D47|nr:uncharacterized protein LOC130636307 [Hydractinia symbiolongicarpus]